MRTLLSSEGAAVKDWVDKRFPVKEEEEEEDKEEKRLAKFLRLVVFGVFWSS